MAETYKKLAQIQIPAAQTQAYVVPASTETIVKRIVLASAVGTDKWAKLWHTDGAAPTNVNLILPSTTISAGGHGEFEGTILMETGDKIYAEAESGSSITLTMYGMEIS